jgi:hypothetical protein
MQLSGDPHNSSMDASSNLSPNRVAEMARAMQAVDPNEFIDSLEGFPIVRTPADN